MPFGSLKPVCFRCKIEESTIWRKVRPDDEVAGKEEIICNDCSIELKKTRVYLNSTDKIGLTKSDDKDLEKETNSECGSSTRNKSDLKDEQSTKQSKMSTRKSTRNRRGSNRLNLNRNLSSSKGKGRRHIFKRNVSSSCSPFLFWIVFCSIKGAAIIPDFLF